MADEKSTWEDLFGDGTDMETVGGEAWSDLFDEKSIADIDLESFGMNYDTDSSENCGIEPNVAMSVFMILIVIVGLFGNAIVFFVILVLKEYKKSVSNWYVLQLALADTLFLLMLPFTASDEMVGKWDFSETLCKAKEGILFVNYYASIFFLTIMSFDRYMAVTKSGVSPWADVLRRLDSAALISLVTWLISICLAVPIYLYSKVNSCKQCSYDFPLSDEELCTRAGVNASFCPTWIEKENSITEPEEHGFTYGELLKAFDPNITDILSNLTKTEEMCQDPTTPYTYRIWLYLNFSVLLVLPFVLICIFYGMILYTMMGTASTASTNQKQYRRRVTLMVLALVTLFAVSWVPWYAITMARIPGFPLGEDGCKRLADFSRVMSYLNSALNPYFYSFMGSRFHQRLLRARTTATRKSRVFTFLSRVSWHGHDSSNSTSGSCRNHNGKDIKLNKIRAHSDDESFNTKSIIRTERTVVDATQPAT